MADEKDKDKEKSISLAIRWLKPGQVQARWETESARLSVRIDGGEEAVDARAGQAFPMTKRGQFVEIADAKGESLGVLETLDGVDPAARKAIEEALAVRYLIPQIRRIVELSESTTFVLRWTVETNRGDRAFQTESTREAVRYLGPDRIRVTDLAGNQYDVPSLSGLDAASRGILGSFL
jgi:hypothetical protein